MVVVGQSVVYIIDSPGLQLGKYNINTTLQTTPAHTLADCPVYRVSVADVFSSLAIVNSPEILLSGKVVKNLNKCRNG